MEEEQRQVEVSAGQSPRALAGVAATVSGSIPETGGNVIGQSQWQVIHERRRAGQNVSQIARELDLDRKTVRNCLRQACWRAYRRDRAAGTLLAARQQWLLDRAQQVHYSARILYQELRMSGWAGSYETVKLAVRPLRAAASVAALTQRRFETEPGEQAQVDWGQLTVHLGGLPTKLHVFVMTLGYSRRAYAEGFAHERMANLLAAHENAFAHFGGRCETILYDRMRTVVLGSSVDGAGEVRPRFNATFEAFARHWGFMPRLCRPYRAQTKGKVESGVKYVKRNFAPGRTFRDLEDFNTQLAAWQDDIADVRIHGTTHQLPIERFAREAPALAPTATQPSFLQAMVRDRVVAEDWLISIDANRYSVPFGLIGQTVQVVREGQSWVIRHRGAVVAEHAVLSGRAQLAVRPEHGPGAVARNARQRHAGPQTVLPDLHGRLAIESHEVEIRDLGLYEQLLGDACREVA